MKVIERAAWTAQPWKNGRGTTLEIVRWRLATDIDQRPMRSPAGGLMWAFESCAADEDYDLRVSLAEVSDSGPFSRFPGYRRHSILVGPAPIHLGDVALIAPGDHIELPGETGITAIVPAGPTQLLNVLVRATLVPSLQVAASASSPAPQLAEIQVEVGERREGRVIVLLR